ncbi:hypothetical protein SEA_SAMTY_55 [Mycobacterium phage Samty]|nr:hypothetical protein SEA_SAMTY_55 [Mycobacterium phage Samty]
MVAGSSPARSARPGDSSVGRALVAVKNGVQLKRLWTVTATLKLSLLMKSNSVQSYRADCLRIQP